MSNNYILRWIKDMFLSKKVILYICITILYVLYSIAYLSYTYGMYKYDYKLIDSCMADGLLIALLPTNFFVFIIPLYLIFLSRILLYDNSVQLILREKNKYQIWRKKAFKTFTFSAIYAFIYITVMYIVSYFIFGSVSCNWNQQGTFFLKLSKNILSYHVSNVEVYMMSIYSVFIISTIFGLFYWLIDCCIKKNSVAILLTILTSLFNAQPNKLFVIENEFIGYRYWVYNESLVYKFLIALGTIGIIYIVGLFCFNRKEYI